MYNKAIAFIVGYYGEEEQLIQTAEEASELAQAAIKRRKALNGYMSPDKLIATRDALAEEIADTLIMIEQIVYVEGFEEKVKKIIDEKIKRQMDRIKAVTDNGS